MNTCVASACARYLVLLILSFTPSAVSEGYAAQFSTANYVFDGPVPLESVIRVSDAKGTANFTSPSLACGLPFSLPASRLAPVTAGSNVSIMWRSPDGSPWRDGHGPILTYMAPCNTSDCSDNPTELQFFKIAQDGQEPGSADWVQARLASAPYNITVPAGLPMGPYILRNEIISLDFAKAHEASTYPCCVQIDVDVSISKIDQNELMSLLKDEIAKFPGAYNQSDPGFKATVDPPSDLHYSTMFPGPPIASDVFSELSLGEPLVRRDRGGSSTTSVATNAGTPIRRPASPPLMTLRSDDSHTPSTSLASSSSKHLEGTWSSSSPGATMKLSMTTSILPGSLRRRGHQRGRH